MRTKKDFDHQNEYNKEKYDRIGLLIPKGLKAEWTKKAEESGLSLTAYITQCVKIAQSIEDVCKKEEK